MDKKITQLGNISGKLLLFGGVYSNLQALEQLVQLSKEMGIPSENCICTGDIIGYCAQPEETIQLFRNWGARSIMGNVEQQLFKGEEDCGCDFAPGSSCDGFSKRWYPFAQRELSKESITWMGQLPEHLSFEMTNRKVMVVHGSYNHISDFIFRSTPESIKKASFSNSKSDVIVAGHCGLPFHQKIQEKIWLNPRVVGMPANEGLSRVWYLILEDEGEILKYAHHHFEYDYISAHNCMIENELPRGYADSIITGLWDNMEILPLEERELRGTPYDFDS